MDQRSREIIHEYKPILTEIISHDEIKSWIKKFNIFTEAMFDDIFNPESDRDFYDELCTRGPEAFTKFLMVLKCAEYHKVADVLEKDIDDRQFPNYYKMDSSPLLGYCLIIINEDFDDVEDTRLGCQVDAAALKNLFQTLNYDVEIQWNKESDEMKTILKEFSQKSEFRAVDSCIVYILSHGGQDKNLDYIYGTDCKKVFKRDIYNMFSNENCNALIGEPKIFFFQACRGKTLDFGVCDNSSIVDANENASNVNDNTQTQNSLDTLEDSRPNFARPRSVEMKYPSFSDMFIVHSSLPDHVSWKNNYAGSWLCQDLVSVVSKYYDKHDLATMMTFVNSKQMHRVSDSGCKQISHFEQLGVTSLLKFK